MDIWIKQSGSKVIHSEVLVRQSRPFLLAVLFIEPSGEDSLAGSWVGHTAVEFGNPVHAVFPDTGLLTLVYLCSWCVDSELVDCSICPEACTIGLSREYSVVGLGQVNCLLYPVACTIGLGRDSRI